MLDAGVDLRDVQIAARHADPRTTMRYDRPCKNLRLAPQFHPRRLHGLRHLNHTAHHVKRHVADERAVMLGGCVRACM